MVRPQANPTAAPASVIKVKPCYTTGYGWEGAGLDDAIAALSPFEPEDRPVILSILQRCGGHLGNYMSAIVSSAKARPKASLINVTSLLQQGAVVLFGVLILFAVGFVPLDVAHNAAHDTRHSFVFPCH